MKDRLFLISVNFGMCDTGHGATVDLTKLPPAGDPSWNRVSSGEQAGLAKGYRHEITIQAAIDGIIVDWTIPAQSFFDLVDTLRSTPRRVARMYLQPSEQLPNCDQEAHNYAIRDMLRNNGLPVE